MLWHSNHYKPLEKDIITKNKQKLTKTESKKTHLKQNSITIIIIIIIIIMWFNFLRFVCVYTTKLQ